MKDTRQCLVIGDIHGSLDELKALIKDIDRNEVRIISVGDLIDRGKDSEGVVDFIRDNNIEAVRGNHEDMLIECIPYLTDDNIWALGGSDWALNGGHDVVKQYSSRDKLITDAKWLDTLPYYIETGVFNEDGKELLVSHAWTSQYKNLEEVKSDFRFVWDRHQPKHIYDTPYYNIFGHTPVDYLSKYKYNTPEDIPEPILYETGANVDTGCAYDRNGRRYLTGMYFPSLEVIQVKLGGE